jgi:hypothetical protein
LSSGRARDLVSAKHYSKYDGVLKTLSWLEELWTCEFDHAEFFVTDTTAACWPSPWEPLSIVGFKTLQIKHCHDLASTLRHKWRDGAANELVDSLQSEFHFYVDDPQKFARSGLAEILKLMDLRMADQLLDLCLRSVDAWVRFLEKHAAAGTALAQEGDEGCNSSDQPAPPAGSKADPAARARVFPLIEAVVSCNEKSAVCSPSREDFESCCLDVLDYMVDALLGLTSVDHSLMSLLALKPRPILPFKSKNPRVAVVNATIAQAKKRISEAVQRIFAPIERMVTAFDEKARVLGGNPKAALNEFVVKMGNAREITHGHDDQDDDEMRERDPSKPRPLEDKTVELGAFKAEILKYLQQAELTRQLSDDNVQEGIFLLRLCTLKEQLTRQGSELVALFALHVYEHQRLEAREITLEYEVIMKRLEVKPKTEEELVQLEAYMTNSESHMAWLMHNVDAIHSWVAMLDECSGQRVAQGKEEEC